MRIQKCLILILSLTLLTACDPQTDELKNQTFDLHEPLTKVVYQESGSRNFKIEIVKDGAAYRLSVLQDGYADYGPLQQYIFIQPSGAGFTLLEQLFNGVIGLQPYVNPCPPCLAGYWAGFSVTLKKNGSEVDVDVDALTQSKLESVINAAYLRLFPPQGPYQLVARSCVSGVAVTDGFDISTDSLELDFISDSEVDIYSEINGVPMFSTENYLITENEIELGSETLHIQLAHGLYGGAELTLTTAPFVGSGGSCPAGDQLISIFH